MSQLWSKLDWNPQWCLDKARYKAIYKAYHYDVNMYQSRPMNICKSKRSYQVWTRSVISFTWIKCSLSSSQCVKWGSTEYDTSIYWFIYGFNHYLFFKSITCNNLTYIIFYPFQGILLILGRLFIMMEKPQTPGGNQLECPQTGCNFFTLDLREASTHEWFTCLQSYSCYIWVPLTENPSLRMFRPR